MAEEQTLQDALNTDDAYVSYRNVVRTIRERNNLKAVIADVRANAAARLLPSMYAEAPTEMKLYKAIGKEIATRSRLTEIRGSLTIDASSLKKALDAISSHVRVNYQDWLADYGKRVDDQKQIIYSVLRHGYVLRDDMATVIDLIDFYIKDIDQANFSASNMTRMYERFNDLTRVPRHA